MDDLIEVPRRRASRSSLSSSASSMMSCQSVNLSFMYRSWPSRFVSVVLILLIVKAISITAQNSTGAGAGDPSSSSSSPEVIVIKPAPLGLTSRDVTLKVGQSTSVILMPSASFMPVFQNITAKTVVLVFHANQEGVIKPLQNITLATEETGPIFQNHTLNITAQRAGLITVTTELIPVIPVYKPDNIFLRVDVYKYETLVVLSNIVGWIYFIAWSISFYPQIIQNYQRKSVRGLSLDFVYLNITGFAVYGIFNIGLYWFKSLQQQYYLEYPQGVIPVQLNDVVFSVHAFFACAVTAIQCLIYDRGAQTVSDCGKMLLCTILVFVFVIFTVAASQAISWLTFLTWCSYVKLVITLIKYIPQAYLNWYRKSTSGWCIGNVLLDFTGGIFSLTQMVFIAFNHNDWSSFFGDLTKFGLGLFSILFDVFFIVQHYVLYRNHAAYEPIEGGDNPNDSNQYGDITTSNHHFQSSLETGEVADSKSGHIIYDPELRPSSSNGVQVGVEPLNGNNNSNQNNGPRATIGHPPPPERDIEAEEEPDSVQSGSSDSE